MKVSTYITFDGNCKSAMNFYKHIFGREFVFEQSWGDSPIMVVKKKDDDTPEEYNHLMLHCALPLSDSFTLMGCDRHPVMYKEKVVVGNNTEIVLNPESKSEADRLFHVLSEGGSVRHPLQDMFWGSYSGSCTDKFGIQWLIDTPSSSTTSCCPLNKKECREIKEQSLCEVDTTSTTTPPSLENQGKCQDMIDERLTKKLKIDSAPVEST